MQRKSITLFPSTENHRFVTLSIISRNILIQLLGNKDGFLYTSKETISEGKVLPSLVLASFVVYLVLATIFYYDV